MNDIASLLGLEFPLIQAGMGGVAGPNLAAAVASAGAGGVLGIYRMRSEAIRSTIQRTRSLTEKPFGVNLIPELMSASGLSAQVEAVLDASDPSVFFTFYGLPDAATAERLADAHRPFLTMIGSAAEIERSRVLGADACILQGTEAGGHLLGTQPLAELVAEARDMGCRMPFLVAGGIESGHTFRAFHEAGASGCLCGTLFVATDESEAHPLYKERLVQANSDETVVTDLFKVGWTGRSHRVLRNSLTAMQGRMLPARFIAEVTLLGKIHPIPRYGATVPNIHVRGNIEEMAMYCGTSVNGINAITSARSRVEVFIAQFREVIPNAPRTGGIPPVRIPANSSGSVRDS